ncbi:GNAT family N-acetyltransferase [Actinomadura rubrisoli]|uniref:GNAT family N-acetyltransferase n=1 Tax=Actinomadura rubrisoli TaxID=2530368 RepID=A0A4V2YT91_9ACTN|nr:GNAT family N-acetyltransferase [Actinomadura rubrisoli]TDD72917.1 GNAT family N-acetyltransferase [Actinomadura rubrisoli]
MPAATDRGVVLRRLGEDDAERYRAFRLRALRDFPAAFTSSFEEESARPLSATVRRLVPPGRPDDAVLGAFDAAGDLVGSAGIAVPPRRQERHQATLFGMAVAPHAGGQGVGRALVERILEIAASAGLLQVGLTVSEGNLPAERLYRSCGFEVWGREPRALLVGGRPVAKLHMVRMLDGHGGPGG